MAGMLAASIDGIERKIEPPAPLQVNAYQLEDLELLPRTLEESVDHFEKDETLLEFFHPEFVKAFIGLKRHEVEKARKACKEYGTESWNDTVTDWERGQFLALA
jgi:glutamine synthetase